MILRGNLSPLHMKDFLKQTEITLVMKLLFKICAHTLGKKANITQKNILVSQSGKSNTSYPVIKYFTQVAYWAPLIPFARPYKQELVDLHLEYL